jgi:hypothetical protein
MKLSAKLGLIALAITGTLASVAPLANADVWFAPRQERYPRGQWITLAANTFGPYQWVLLRERSSRGTRELGWAYFRLGLCRPNVLSGADRSQQGQCVLSWPPIVATGSSASHRSLNTKSHWNLIRA